MSEGNIVIVDFEDGGAFNNIEALFSKFGIDFEDESTTKKDVLTVILYVLWEINVKTLNALESRLVAFDKIRWRSLFTVSKMLRLRNIYFEFSQAQNMIDRLFKRNHDPTKFKINLDCIKCLQESATKIIKFRLSELDKFVHVRATFTSPNLWVPLLVVTCLAGNTYQGPTLMWIFFWEFILLVIAYILV